MTNSILESTKKVLGFEPEYKAYDLDIMMHINTVFTTLQQLGVGPVNGYMIESDQEEWSDFLGNNLTLNSVKTYVYLRVKLVFDPPPTSFAIAAMEEQVKEQEWRISARREEVAYPWTPPSTSSSSTTE